MGSCFIRLPVAFAIALAMAGIRANADFPNALHAKRMIRVGYLNQDRLDHGDVGRHGHAVVEEACVLQFAIFTIDVLFIERPADTLHNTALYLTFNIAWVLARPQSCAATNRNMVTLPVSGSTSTSQNCVAKPGA